MVVGECMLMPTSGVMAMVAKMLAELDELYVKSDNSAMAVFHGEVLAVAPMAGTIKLPEYTHAALNGKKVVVFVGWFKPEPAEKPQPLHPAISEARRAAARMESCAKCANNTRSAACSECHDYDRFIPREQGE